VSSGAAENTDFELSRGEKSRERVNTEGPAVGAEPAVNLYDERGGQRCRQGRAMATSTVNGFLITQDSTPIGFQGIAFGSQENLLAANRQRGLYVRNDVAAREVRNGSWELPAFGNGRHRQGHDLARDPEAEARSTVGRAALAAIFFEVSS
jgi:hypothetical protein